MGYEYGNFSRYFQPLNSSILRGNFKTLRGCFSPKTRWFLLFFSSHKGQKFYPKWITFYSIPSPQWLKYWITFHIQESPSGSSCTSHCQEWGGSTVQQGETASGTLPWGSWHILQPCLWVSWLWLHWMWKASQEECICLTQGLCWPIQSEAHLEEECRQSQPWGQWAVHHKSHMTFKNYTGGWQI